jgi:hypothetical protein
MILKNYRKVLTSVSPQLLNTPHFHTSRRQKDLVRKKMSYRKETQADKVERSLFWFGDLRDCSELAGTNAETEGRERHEFWHEGKDHK